VYVEPPYNRTKIYAAHVIIIIIIIIIDIFRVA